MVLIFVCLDWIAPIHPAKETDLDGLSSVMPSDVRVEILAICIARFEGASAVLVTSRMAGHRPQEIQDTPGALRVTLRDSVSTSGDSPYKLASDFTAACYLIATKAFQRVAIAGSKESFPSEHRHPVAEFTEDERAFKAACSELGGLLIKAGERCGGGWRAPGSTDGSSEFRLAILRIAGSSTLRDRNSPVPMSTSITGFDWDR